MNTAPVSAVEELELPTIALAGIDSDVKSIILTSILSAIPVTLVAFSFNVRVWLSAPNTIWSEADMVAPAPMAVEFR